MLPWKMLQQVEYDCSVTKLKLIHLLSVISCDLLF